jgi:hypothetical protein
VNPSFSKGSNAAVKWAAKERSGFADPSSTACSAKTLVGSFDATSPVPWPSFVVSDCHDHDHLRLNSVHQTVREMVQDFPPYATPSGHCGIGIFGDKHYAPTNFCNEPESDPWRFVFVVPNRLAELLISFGKEF